MSYDCKCGCGILRERIAILERDVQQLAVMVENLFKAQGESKQSDRRFIGDKVNA